MTAVPRPSSEPSLRLHLEQARGGPTVLRIVLGTQLRNLREAAGISRERAGDAIRGSHAKISRMELGRVGFKERDIADLLTLYGVADEAVRDEYLALARQANSPGWWQQYSDVMEDWFATLIGLEESASLIRTYEVQFVPGLLQTEEYARAVVGLGNPQMPPREIERRVALRIKRQRLLTAPDAPRLWAVLDEAALRRPMGGPRVMRAQIEKLLAAIELPNVTLQVAPFDIGGLASAGGPITILRFQRVDLPDIVYLEQLTSALYLDKEDDVDNYLAVMDRLCAKAQPPAETADFLNSLLKQYT
jgi:transcriptional regulator with XRE-family HTH domain